MVENRRKIFGILMVGVLLVGSLLLFFWSIGSVSASWWNSTWTYKKNITINHSKVNQTQTNFPVLINLTDTDLITKAQADGDDIAFTNSTGSQLVH